MIGLRFKTNEKRNERMSNVPCHFGVKKKIVMRRDKLFYYKYIGIYLNIKCVIIKCTVHNVN